MFAAAEQAIATATNVAATAAAIANTTAATNAVVANAVAANAAAATNAAANTNAADASAMHGKWQQHAVARLCTDQLMLSEDVRRSKAKPVRC
jgi:hypothetical protein